MVRTRDSKGDSSAPNKRMKESGVHSSREKSQPAGEVSAETFCEFLYALAIEASIKGTASKICLLPRYLLATLAAASAMSLHNLAALLKKVPLPFHLLLTLMSHMRPVPCSKTSPPFASSLVRFSSPG
eukprot:4937484-Amphidinium_carterae.1